MVKCDVAVVGSGPGGHAAAIRLARYGLSVVMIEEREVGGLCVNRGCVPTKAVALATSLLRKIKKAPEFGIVTDGVRVNLDWLARMRDLTVERVRSSLTLCLDSLGIRLLKGHASLTGPNEVAVDGKQVIAKDVVIASGSKASMPSIRGLAETAITSDDLMGPISIPGRLVIVGGGVVGIEWASVFSGLGSRVDVVEMEAQIIPGLDREIAGYLVDALQRNGVTVHLSTRVEEVSHGRAITTAGPIDFDRILVATGRIPDTSLGDALGISSPNGIIVDERMQTRIPHVWAVGDCVGAPMLAHVAMAEAEVASTSIMGGDARMSYDCIPSCVFSYPEVAWVGLSEDAAIDEGIPISVGRCSFAASGKAVALGEAEGLVKVIADERDRRVLGVHIMGHGATELISEAACCIGMGVDAVAWGRVVHAHPTLSEVLIEAVRAAVGKALYV
ncbi:MAG TPA: dihydrolipoyl dehydrogenase [Clostridia bacterium]|nr:dihydrolipoyl dehydrogenase [Clostridia bacterium]